MRSCQAMSLTAGRVLITDFDGTLVRLAVDWDDVRTRAGVRRIGEVWFSAGHEAFEIVAAAEREGALRGEDIAEAIEFAGGFDRFAVLSGNSRSAVEVFFDRNPLLRERCAAVVGRETLPGPKHEFEHFRRAVDVCLQSLGVGAAAGVSYLGDSAYELDFARSLGLAAVDVSSLTASPP